MKLSYNKNVHIRTKFWWKHLSVIIFFYENKICLSNPLELTSFRGKCNTNSREKWVFYFKSLRKEYNKRCRTLALTIFVKLEGLSISLIATTMRKGKGIIQIASYL